jgi:tRNA 2-thiouridine synthesizing protein A
VKPTSQRTDPDFGPVPIEVDARGLRCPLPVIRLAEAARAAPAGTHIVVLATDPAARHDIPAWCRMRHHELVGLDEVAERDDPSYLRIVVRILPQANAGGSGSESARPSRAM